MAGAIVVVGRGVTVAVGGGDVAVEGGTVAVGGAVLVGAGVAEGDGVWVSAAWGMAVAVGVVGVVGVAAAVQLTKTRPSTMRQERSIAVIRVNAGGGDNSAFPVEPVRGVGRRRVPAHGGSRC